MKKIITICRSFGAEGHEIGKELSERLQIPLYDKDILGISAKNSHMDLDYAAELDEKIPSKIMSHYFLTTQEVELDKLFKEETNLILQLAEKESCIIVGRMADYILRDRDDCLNVFITASLVQRVHIIQEKYNISQEDSEKIIRKMDVAREQFYKYYSNGKWTHETNKDIVLNRGTLGVSGCVDILEYIYQNNFMETNNI